MTSLTLRAQSKTVTIKDVAARAGVSVGTVSRVLANESAVKAALKERVNKAVEDLNYRVNFAARALRKNHIDVIGLVVPDITNPFFAQLAKNLEAEAEKRGYSVMLANSHGELELERKQISALLDRAVRGIVIVAASDGESQNIDTSVPIVSLDRRFSNFPLVATDHVGGAAMIADHLYELGHRRIAYIAGPQNTQVGRMRRRGFVDRISAHSKADNDLELEIYEGQFDYESGETIARDILSVSGSKPTAIAAASDQQAIGALRCARDLSLDVPKDISITGFDDISLASLVVPRLTTIQQPTSLLAQSAIHFVFSEGEQNGEGTISGQLKIRGSTAGPKR